MISSEVINEQLHSYFLELFQRRRRLGRIHHQGAFGQLKLDQFRGHASGRKHAPDTGDEPVIVEVERRQIDGKWMFPSGLASGMALSKRRLQNPVRQRCNDASLFCERDKFDRRDHSSQWMLPLNKCFGTADLLPSDLDLRLAIQAQFGLPDGPVQIPHQRQYARTMPCFESASPLQKSARWIHRSLEDIASVTHGEHK
jgi:hypothetical protein